MKSAILACLLIGAAACAAPSAAFAQGPYNSFYYGWNNGYMNGMPWYAPTYNNQVQPYYSQNPPVYYSSTILRRPYGTSPYAMPAINPYSSSSAISTGGRPAPSAPAAPQVIINPFVDGAANWSPPSTAGSVKEALLKPSETLPTPTNPARTMRVLPPSPPSQ